MICQELLLVARVAAIICRRRQRRFLQFGRRHKLLFGLAVGTSVMAGDAVVMVDDAAVMAGGAMVMAGSTAVMFNGAAIMFNGAAVKVGDAMVITGGAVVIAGGAVFVFSGAVVMANVTVIEDDGVSVSDFLAMASGVFKTFISVAPTVAVVVMIFGRIVF